MTSDLILIAQTFAFVAAWVAPCVAAGAIANYLTKE